MDPNFIQVTIGNNTYYLEASRIPDLAFIDGKLVNVSNSSITMVTSFDYSTTYPRITCSGMSACILRSSSSSNYSVVTQNIQLPGKFNMNTLSDSMLSTIIIGLLTVVIGLKLLWKR